MVAFGIEGVIKSCYNKGAINEIYTGSGGTVGIGGVVGYNYNGKVENCYNAGKITSDREDGIGSIVGFSSKENIKNCYYDSSNSFGGIGTPIETDIMKTEEFVDILNNHDPKRPYEYDSNNINEGYPILIAEDYFKSEYEFEDESEDEYEDEYDDEYEDEDEDEYEYEDDEYTSNFADSARTKSYYAIKSIALKTVGIIIVLSLIIFGFLYFIGVIDLKKVNKD